MQQDTHDSTGLDELFSPPCLSCRLTFRFLNVCLQSLHRRPCTPQALARVHTLNIPCGVWCRILFELKMSIGIYSPNRTKKRPPNTIVRRRAIIIFCSIHPVPSHDMHFRMHDSTYLFHPVPSMSHPSSIRPRGDLYSTSVNQTTWFLIFVFLYRGHYN